jgi:hypothetical protein
MHLGYTPYISTTLTLQHYNIVQRFPDTNKYKGEFRAAPVADSELSCDAVRACEERAAREGEWAPSAASVDCRQSPT